MKRPDRHRVSRKLSPNRHTPLRTKTHAPLYPHKHWSMSNGNTFNPSHTVTQHSRRHTHVRCTRVPYPGIPPPFTSVQFWHQSTFFFTIEWRHFVLQLWVTTPKHDTKHGPGAPLRETCLKFGFEVFCFRPYRWTAEMWKKTWPEKIEFKAILVGLTLEADERRRKRRK